MAKANTRVLLFTGGDLWQRKSAVTEIQKKQFGDAEVEILRFDASAGETLSALDEVLSYSLLAESRMVLLENADATSKAELAELVNYVSKPRGDTPFLLFAASEKETPKALLDAMAKPAIRPLNKTSKAQIQQLVRERCSAQKITFPKEALDFFLQACGDQVDAVLRELDKLLLWAGENGSISLDVCRRLVQTEAEKNIWAITNAVGEKNVTEALHALETLLTQGEDEVAITGRLIATFRGLYLCKSLSLEKVPESEWSRRLGQSGYGLTKTKERSAGFSLRDLRAAVVHLRNLDNDLKGGRPIPSPSHRRILLERAVIDLCQSH